VVFVFRPKYLGGTMFLYLPCGRALTYTDLRKEPIKVEDPDTGETETQWKWRYQSGYERKVLWHGILAENITQATAASLLRAALKRGEYDKTAPADIVGHTHDEIVVECDEGRVDETKVWVQDLMEFAPDWAEGLPLVAEISSHWYYTKTEG
jgi:hypothetical protein